MPGSHRLYSVVYIKLYFIGHDKLATSSGRKWELHPKRSQLFSTKYKNIQTVFKCLLCATIELLFQLSPAYTRVHDTFHKCLQPISDGLTWIKRFKNLKWKKKI